MSQSKQRNSQPMISVASLAPQEDVVNTTVGNIENESWFLFALGLFVIVGSNISIFASGWLNEVPTTTGIFVLDLLLEFFPTVLKNPSAKTIFDTMGGVAMSASTAVIFEGSRRRGPNGRFSQWWLAAYWWVAQFVAIGFATPLFLGFFLQKRMQNKDYVHVGGIRVYAVLIAMLLTSGLNYMLEQKLDAGESVVNLLIAFLFVPVVIISVSIVVDRSEFAWPVVTPIQFIYGAGILVGIAGHYRVMKLVMNSELILSDIMFNPPCVFLIFDLIGVMVGSYYWLHCDGRIGISEFWYVALLFGPSAHFSLLCMLRDGQIDDNIEAQKHE